MALLTSLFCAVLAGADVDVPEVRDARLRIELFAEAPDIVTPIGIAVDRRDRVFVVESHTHLAPKDYPGPVSDRVKIFIDADDDGRAEKVTVFADGFDDAMSLALSAEEDLYLCHRAGVVALFDRDGNGVSDDREEILRLDTSQTYAHSCLLGIAFSPDGWLYVSRGNLGGHPYALRCRDGSLLEGYGDGGNIVRLRPDGSDLEEVATGFWNPFALAFGPEGRLLCVDNDPDSRGPNRLLHIVPNGDYGFKALFGPSGRHPYDAWNGELPGTLPMVAAVGEAPSGILDCGRARFPQALRGDVLVTVWGEHTVERFRLEPAGASIRARSDVLVAGGEQFRPVGIAAGVDGVIYITDWVKREYPNHGQGRIWRLSPRSVGAAAEGARAGAAEARFTSSPPSGILGAARPGDFFSLMHQAESADPFVRAAAIAALSKGVDRTAVFEELEAESPLRRLTALLALRRSDAGVSDSELEKLLADPDEAVRRMALVWIGETQRESMRSSVGLAIAGGDVSATLLGTYLATVQALSPEELEPTRRRVPGFRIKRDVRQALVEALFSDLAKPVPVRAMALAFIDATCADRTRETLIRLALSGEGPLREEAMWTLVHMPLPDALQALAGIALDRKQPGELRADALVGLYELPETELEKFIPLLEASDPAVAIEAARLLRKAVDREPVRDALTARQASLRSQEEGDEDLRAHLRLALFSGPPAVTASDRPATLEGWQQRVAEGGDAKRGRRVFSHGRYGCASCHRLRGRGGRLGPDLSGIAASSSRAELVEAILRPGAEVAPEFQSYTVVLRNGTTLNGLQFHFRGTERFSLMLRDGREIRRGLTDVLWYGADPESLMPRGLEREMTVGDVRDLVAFLMSQK